MDKDLDYWLGVYVQWFDFLVKAVGPESVFLLSLAAVALGVQLSCEGSRKRKASMTGMALTLTGAVALGQGTALAGMYFLSRGAFRGWWWMTAGLVVVAGFAFAAQVVQHVRLVWPAKTKPNESQPTPATSAATAGEF